MNSHEISLWLASNRTIQDWGWALFHSLWQNTMVATALALTLGLIDRQRAQLRYAASGAAMLAMLIIPLVTFGYLHQSGEASTTTLAAVPLTPLVTVDFTGTPVASSSMTALFQQALPWLVLAWAVGVAFYFSRLAGGYWLTRRTRQLAMDERVPERLVTLVEELRERLRLTLPVQLVASPLDSPAVIGVFKPVILVPLGLMASMPAAQVEALLAHELAHIARRDYFVNLLQTAAEALLFYHPATWWVSKQMRKEREHCCDDVAVQICGNATVYARALASLEERRATTLALAANERPLLDRLSRVLKMEARTTQPRLVPVTMATLAVLAAGSLVAALQPAKEAAKLNESHEIPHAVAGGVQGGISGVAAHADGERLLRSAIGYMASVTGDQPPPPPEPPSPPADAKAPAPPPPPPVPVRPARPSRNVPPPPPAPPVAPEPANAPPPPPPPPPPGDISQMSHGSIEMSENGRGFRMNVRNGHVTELIFNDHGDRWRTEDPAVIAQVQKLFEPMQRRAQEQRSLADQQRRVADKQRREAETQMRYAEREAKRSEEQARRFEYEARRGESEAKLAEERAHREAMGDKASAEKMAQEAERFAREAQRNRDLMHDQKNRDEDLRREQESKMKAMGEDMERMSREMEAQSKDMERENQKLRKQLDELLEKLKREGKLRKMGFFEGRL